ncbi:MAG: replicative DNA helicase [Rickettsiales bacterium]|nr:replicative DNA helicase [Rickettsiales bacterium]
MEFNQKTLPTNLEAEQAVLAAVLMNNRALEKVSDFLSASHFSHPAHTEIFRLAEKQFAAGIPFDVITAKNYLEQQGVLESVGGTEYLSELAAAGTSVYNVESYAKIVYDNALRRQLISVGQDIVDGAFIEDMDNPADKQIEAAEQKLFDLSATGNVERGATSLDAALRTALEEAEIAYKADGKLSGLTTGLRDLDKSISGLHKSDLVIIAGRPAMGKTTVALNIAFNAANAILSGRANKKFTGAVVFFSLEMSASQLAARVLSSQAKIPAGSMRNGSLNDQEFLRLSQYSDALSSVPLLIDDTPGIGVAGMRARARRIARKYGGIALIVIDYLQLMQSSSLRKNDNRVNEISEITRGLKMLAKELDAPVIALSQLSRAVEMRDDKRPLLSDLRESGSIEQDADIVMFTYREEYYLQGRDPSENTGDHSEQFTTNKAENWRKRLEAARGKADLIIGKNRHGKPDTIRTKFSGDYSLFEDLDGFAMDDDMDYGENPAVMRGAAPDVSEIPDNF